MTRRPAGHDRLSFWLGWVSPVPLVWLWHAAFDGTRLCPCWHSRAYRDLSSGATCRRQHDCGNCDLCILPLEMLIKRGVLCTSDH